MNNTYALVARYAKEFPDADVWYEFEPEQIKLRFGNGVASVDLPVLKTMTYTPFEEECLEIRRHLSGH